MSAAYIALGSNLENPLQQLSSAVDNIRKLPRSQVRRVSAVFQSTALGPGQQPDYLNAVLLLETGLPPLTLLDQLQLIETKQGRVRSERWGPRTLDLDLLLYDDLQLISKRLTLPHPAMSARNFVLYPLAQVWDYKMKLPDGTELDTLIADCPAADLVETGQQLECKAK